MPPYQILLREIGAPGLPGQELTHGPNKMSSALSDVETSILELFNDVIAYFHLRSGALRAPVPA